MTEQPSTDSAPGDDTPRRISRRRLLIGAAVGIPVIAASAAGVVALRSAGSPRHAGILTGHTDFVTSVAFSPDGTLLASGSGDTTVRLWNVRTGQPDGQPLRNHMQPPVQSVAFSPDGTVLASCGHEGMDFWNVGTREQAEFGYSRGDDSFDAVAFSPDGNRVAFRTSKSVQFLRAKATGSKGDRFVPEGTSPTAGQIFADPNDSFVSMAFSRDSMLLATTSFDPTVQLWNVQTCQPDGPRLTGHTDRINSVAFSPDGTLLATCSGNSSNNSHDKTVRLWDSRTREPAGPSLASYKAVVRSVVFSPDGALLAVDGDGRITLWDVHTRQPVQHFTGTGGPSTMAFSPDGTLLATGSMDNAVLLLKVNKTP